MLKSIELLAPAGGMKQLTAAVENGADAVYLGGQRFNARINANNFTQEEFRDAVSYAHLRNVKVYVTLNTLLKDDELLTALKYATKLYNLGVDGLILQDLGLAGLVTEHLPDLPIHLSTQGTIYNLSGVKAAGELGFSRVVLARETSLGEINAITKANICDIEVFVHGALCMCYSGQCQMSRVLGAGGRSGNRGLCAQPCRLPYTDDEGRTGYALSPKDICTVDHIGSLIEAGVTALKIEGRMKSPEYVATVVGIYRKYLDAYYRDGRYTVDSADREALLQIFSRGGFTKGYLFENPRDKILSGDLPKHQGIYLGRVANIPQERDLIDIETKEPIELGDGIEIRSEELTGNVVTYSRPLGKNIVRVGDIKGTVSPGDAVYRITKVSLMKKVQSTYEAGGPNGIHHKKRIPVEMDFEVKIGKSPTLIIKEGGLRVKATEHSVVAERAINRPLSVEIAEKQLKKTGGTPFEVVRCTTRIEKGSSLSVSTINEIRRNAIQVFKDKKLAQRLQVNAPTEIAPMFRNAEKVLAFYFYEGDKIQHYGFKEVLTALGAEKARVYIPLQYFMETTIVIENIELIPYILNVSKGRLDRYIKENFEIIVDRIKGCGISIGNLGWVREFVKAGVTVYADYGLNLYNMRAVARVEALGLVPTCMSHEAYNAQEGPIPLMITEHPIRSKALLDRKNQGYKIIRNQQHDKWMVLSNKKCIDLNTWKKQWEDVRGEMRIYVT